MSNLEVALGYVGRGWRIFPTHWITPGGACSCGQTCTPQGKHPVPRRGALDASDDPGRVTMWWRHRPNANIAIATGWQSRLYVIDLDGPEGEEAWDALTLIHDAPPTREARTGGGGRHVYYALPFYCKTLPNTAKRLGSGIDTRGRGGYVLAPPSNHVSGNRYAWLNDRPPAPLPDWMLERLRTSERKAAPPKAYVSRARKEDPIGLRILDEECRLVAGTAPGGRNGQLFKSAANAYEIAYGGAISPEAVMAGMIEAGLACGLALREIESTLASAQRHGKDNPREIRTRQAEGAR